MTPDAGRRPDKTLGRKRDTERTDAILEAAGDLLLDVGFDKLRIQDVAERAGSSTATIYRRWPNKEALLAEAIRAMPTIDADITDDPDADLKTLVDQRCSSAANKPDLVPGLISAMRADEGIEKAVKDGYTVENLRNAIARIIGPDHPHLSILTDLTNAITLLRSAFTPETLDPQQTAHEIVSLIQSTANHTPPQTRRSSRDSA